MSKLYSIWRESLLGVCGTEQHKSQWEIQQREDEITELQHALSDMQVITAAYMYVYCWQINSTLLFTCI